MRRFTFVHVPKTGGELMWSLLGARKSHTSVAEHVRACGAREWTTGRWTFAVVRNPWDRLVSWYKYLRGHALVGPALKPSRDARLAASLPFGSWARAVLRRDRHDPTYPRWGPARCQLDMLVVRDDGDDGVAARTPAVHTLYRFERLRDAVADAMTRLGRSAPDRLGVVNASSPLAGRGHYSEWYAHDPALVDLVGRWFEADCVAFGYRFEHGPGDAQVHAMTVVDAAPAQHATAKAAPRRSPDTTAATEGRDGTWQSLVELGAVFTTRVPLRNRQGR